MSSTTWIAAIDSVAKSDPVIRARCWNMANEMRVSWRLAEFRAALEKHYLDLRSRGSVPEQAARNAFDSLVRRTKADKADWLGLLRLPAADTVPNRMVTHICRRRLERYTAPDDDIPDSNLKAHRRVWLSGPFKVSKDGSVEDHFIWLTFSTPEAPLSDDPTEMTRRLGLAHFPPGQLMYRLAFAVTAADLCVPTCFDAGFYEAWAPPPPCHAAPWGMTRDLVSGEPAYPEVLAWTENHRNDRPVACVVSPPDEIRMIEVIEADFMAGRTS